MAELHESTELRRKRAWFTVIGALCLSSFMFALLGGALQHVDNGTLRFLGSLISVNSMLEILAGISIFILLVRYTEIALALFFLVGLVKGDPRLSASPIDLTVLTAVIIIAGVCWRLFYLRNELRVPNEYLLYVPLLAMMVVSLSYTPDFSAGLDKVLRFVGLTGIGIVTPFVVFDTTDKIRRCFYVLAIGGVALAINSMTMLGGTKRFVSPSGLNTELGAASAVALIVIWGLLFPWIAMVWRLMFYPVIGILIVALLGSGGRFANVSAAFCVLIAVLLCPRLSKDVFVVCGIAVLALPLSLVPSASYTYLDSLRQPTQAMGTRDDLMALGLKVISEHPILGVGVDGFRFVSPNPNTYNYPHNLILELGSEMGIFASLAFVLIAFCAFRESIKQLFSPLTERDPLTHTVFILLIYVFLDAMISGDINDLRFMWFIFALPFVLRGLQTEYIRRLMSVRHNSARRDPSQMSRSTVSA
jgi:O-antigen ligase